MALTKTRNANTLFLTGTSAAETAVTTKNIIVTHVFLTAGAAAETLTLTDLTTAAVKLVVYAAANTTEQFPNSEMEMLFPNGIVVTLTQATSFATLILKESRA